MLPWQRIKQTARIWLRQAAAVAPLGVSAAGASGGDHDGR
jgi:hypothetical protein